MPVTDPSPLSRLRALVVAGGLAAATVLGACSGGDEPTPGQGGEGTDVNTDFGEVEQGESDLGRPDGEDPRTGGDGNSGVDEGNLGDGTQTDAGDTGTGSPNVGGSPEE